MTRRFLLALLPVLIVAVLPAALPALLNLVAHPVVHAVSGLLLGYGCWRAPALCRLLLARLAPDASAPALSLGAAGVAAAATFGALGLFALVSSRLDADFIETVPPLFFPGAALAGILAGLGRFGYLETLRWFASEADDEASS